MLPAANRGVGQNLCFPDVCLTPPPLIIGTPVPYVNVALHANAVPFSITTYICMLNALTVISQIPTTQGDEPGIYGPGPMELGVFTMGNPIVFVDMLPAINLTCPATGNAANAAGMHAVPNLVNVFFCYAAGADAAPSAGRPLGAGDLDALAASLEDAPPPRATLLEDGILYLRIAVFTEDLSTRVYNEIAGLQASAMRALILDLRGSPGGEWNAFLGLAGDFLPRGAILARMVDGDGDEVIHRSQRERPYEMPLAVLVDGGTASAAELFAGCLKAHGRAVIVGETTYGKGSAQQVVHAADGVSTLYATLAQCLLPGGEVIDGGIRPDIEVELVAPVQLGAPARAERGPGPKPRLHATTPEAGDPRGDSQLAAAIAALTPSF